MLSPGSETSLQVYFDRSNRLNETYGFGLNTLDLDFQHHWNWGRRQDLVWGLGFRNNADDTAATLRVSFSPPDLTTQIYSAFVQDEIAIRPNHLYINLGTKFEHEYYNGFNLQPTARITVESRRSRHVVGRDLRSAVHAFSSADFGALQLRCVSRAGWSSDPD